MAKNTKHSDNLARMIQKGFDAQDKRFGQVNERLDKIDRRLYHIQNVLLAEHSRRIEKLELKVQQLAQV
ncbi:MAG: hypothetical protein Q8R12_02915 [bacterium]|nr:hypothetical protein [bacterium]